MMGERGRRGDMVGGHKVAWHGDMVGRVWEHGKGTQGHGGDMAEGHKDVQGRHGDRVHRATAGTWHCHHRCGREGGRGTQGGDGASGTQQGGRGDTGSRRCKWPRLPRVCPWSCAPGRCWH